MNDEQTTWYIHEIFLHVIGLQIAFDMLINTISDPKLFQTRLVWVHTTTLLSHAAMISKYTNTSSKNSTAKNRAQLLASILNIDQASPIYSRTVRNSVEHFDERMDSWLSQSVSAIVETVFPTRDYFNYMTRRSPKIKRAFIAEDMVFITEDKNGAYIETDILPLVAESERIGIEAEKWINDNSPYQFIYPQVHDNEEE